MSDTNTGMQASSPELKQTVSEVQGSFPSDQAMQDALGRLTLAGYDRADFSLPTDRLDGLAATPNESADNPTDATDQAQLRTMGSSMAGTAGAIAAAGITMATGGAAAVAVAAAAAVGLGAGLGVDAVGAAITKSASDERDERASKGDLILAVRTRDAAQATEVAEIMKQAGASDVTPVDRGDMTAGFSSASWTGA